MIASRPAVIGLLGGMSWQSTLEYYRLLNALTAERSGGLHAARLVMVSVDFGEIEPLMVAGRWDEAGDALATAAAQVEAGGADLLLLCTNTLHIVADRIEAAIKIPLLHIVDVAAAAVQAAGVTTVGLLGTAFTMDEPFYRERLASHGLTVLVPDDSDRTIVHRIIFDELVYGSILPESREAYRGVIDRLANAGAEGVILGCTEIELLVSEADSRVPLFPTTRLHVEAALAAAQPATS